MIFVSSRQPVKLILMKIFQFNITLNAVLLRVLSSVGSSVASAKGGNVGFNQVLRRVCVDKQQSILGTVIIT